MVCSNGSRRKEGVPEVIWMDATQASEECFEENPPWYCYLVGTLTSWTEDMVAYCGNPPPDSSTYTFSASKLNLGSVIDATQAFANYIRAKNWSRYCECVPGGSPPDLQTTGAITCSTGGTLIGTTGQNTSSSEPFGAGTMNVSTSPANSDFDNFSFNGAAFLFAGYALRKGSWRITCNGGVGGEVEILPPPTPPVLPPGVPPPPQVPVAGQRGPQGERGLQGESIVGPQGERGLTGERGLQGESIVGPQGERGLTGERGLQGESIVGPQGEKGEDLEMEFEVVTVPIIQCQDQMPITLQNSIQVIKGTSNAVRLEFEQLAILRAEQCRMGDLTIVAPEEWQIVPEGHRPQLVFAFREVNGNKLKKTNWPITIPHYNVALGKPKQSPIPSYQKGNFEYIWVLKDNSKVILHCISKEECNRLHPYIAGIIDPAYIPARGPRVGERIDAELPDRNVIPVLAKFFPQGRKDVNPKWVAYF